MIQRFPVIVVAALMMAVGISGCEVIGDIFKAGLWVGIIIVVIIVALVVWLIRKFRGTRG